MPKQSIFFNIAKEITNKNKLKLINSTYSQEIINNHSLYQPVLGKKTKLTILETSPENSEAKICVISSPEAEAIGGAGAFVLNTKSKKLEFSLPRFHLGSPAQLDMEVAMYQLANTKLFKKILDKTTAENSGIIYFAREGHLTQWQQAVFLTTGQNLPTTLVSINHKQSSNLYTRESHFNSQPNLEGFNKEKLKTIFLCDPIASGMQQVSMVEKLKEMGYLPEQLIVIAPMATLFGLSVLAEVCKNYKIKLVIGVCSSILDTNKPLCYYSPYPINQNQVAKPKFHKALSLVFGEVIHKFCIRANWTASFWGGPNFPLQQSEDELVTYGLSNQKLFSLSKKLTIDKAKDLKIFSHLTPYSTKIALKQLI